MKVKLRQIKRAIEKVSSIVYRDKVINFDSFTLTIDSWDRGGTMYANPEYWSDLVDPLQKEIIDKFDCNIYLDVGANYGFTSLANLRFKENLEVIAVEPSNHLVKYLRKNLSINNYPNYVIVEAICSEIESESTSFYLNPTSSQDNRVIGLKGWKAESVKSVTIDSLLKEKTESDTNIRPFIKIDTQGFEDRVIRGARQTLANNSHWVIKMEFAPKWLESQGTEPTTFLERLVNDYSVYELPKRSRYYDSLSCLNNYKIGIKDCEEFVKYNRKLANGNGWCDLLITHSSVHL